MTSIWTDSGKGWELANSDPFPDEKTLQGLVSDNPQLLPLAGSPRIVVLGREVNLGTGVADILAVETSGRPVLIEVKLARNREARRAIVAQALAYAASLYHQNVSDLEEGPLHHHLQSSGFSTIVDAVSAQDQEGAVDVASFTAILQEHLDGGQFRLVLVLDEVPRELELIIAYLDAMTVQALTVDLVTVRVFEINGVKIALPQRISAEVTVISPVSPPDGRWSGAAAGIESAGSDAFVASVVNVPGEDRIIFDRLINWSERLEQHRNVRVFSYSGVRRFGLLPRIRPGNGGLITITNDQGSPGIRVWRSVFERLAPNSIAVVENAIAPVTLGQGTMVRDFSTQVLDAISAAYQEAAGDPNR